MLQVLQVASDMRAQQVMIEQQSLHLNRIHVLVAKIKFLILTTLYLITLPVSVVSINFLAIRSADIDY